MIWALDCGRAYLPRRVRLLHNWVMEVDRPTWASFVSFALMGGATPVPAPMNLEAVGHNLDVGDNDIFFNDPALEGLDIEFPGACCRALSDSSMLTSVIEFRFRPWTLGPGVPYEVPWARDPVVMQPYSSLATAPWRPRILGIPEMIMKASHPFEAFLWTIWHQMEPVVLPTQFAAEEFHSWLDGSTERWSPVIAPRPSPVRNLSVLRDNSAPPGTPELLYQ